MRKFLEVTIYAIAVCLSVWCATLFFPDPVPYKGMRVFPVLPGDAFRPLICCLWSSFAFGALTVVLVRKRPLRRRVLLYGLSCLTPHAALLVASLVFTTYEPDNTLGVNFHRFPVILVVIVYVACGVAALIAFSREAISGQPDKRSRRG